MKLLIIDDETRTRELLRNYIEWDEIDVLEVETARNGLAALKLASEWYPDVILCDIRMPKMDGIEFASQYRKIDSNVPIIFLSGFSDKQYLKSAINLKALTYLEKPVNLGEVREAVAAAVVQRRDEMSKMQEARQLQAGVDRSLPYLRQEMVRKLIAHPESPHVEPALRSRETFILPSQGPYTVCAANLYWNPMNHPEDPASTQEKMLADISDHKGMQKYSVLAGFDKNNRLVMILPGSHGSTYQNGRETIEEIAVILNQIAGAAIDLRLGVGTQAASLLDIPEAFNRAILCANYQYYRSDARPFFADGLGKDIPIDKNWEEVRGMRDHLRKGEIEEAQTTVRSWTAYARERSDLDILRLKDSYFQFLLAAMETAIQLGLADQPEDAERRYMWKEIDRIPNLDALERFVLSFLESFADQQEDNACSGPAKVREIERYIQAHFHEKGFTIRTIAEKVSLSETYLCAYFKKQRGITIKEYISEARVQKAKELLRDKDAKLFEVALLLGFADANYFTTFFKRHAGLTPSEFRERAAK